MPFGFLLEQLLNGLIISAIYALIAVGLSLIFGVLKLVNFSHGEIYMLGGYTYYFLIKLLRFPPLLGLLFNGYPPVSGRRDHRKNTSPPPQQHQR